MLVVLWRQNWSVEQVKKYWRIPKGKHRKWWVMLCMTGLNVPYLFSEELLKLPEFCFDAKIWWSQPAYLSKVWWEPAVKHRRLCCDICEVGDQLCDWIRWLSEAYQTEPKKQQSYQLQYITATRVNADKSGDGTIFGLRTCSYMLNGCLENKMKARFGLYPSMTWIFAKKLRTLGVQIWVLSLGMHYQAIPDQKPTLPKGGPITWSTRP